MPKLHLTAKEAASLAAKRKRDKAHNTALQAVVEKIKPRLKKGGDPLEAAIVTSILNDVRRMMR